MSEQKDISQAATDSVAKGAETTSAASETKAHTAENNTSASTAAPELTTDAKVRSFPLAPYKPAAQYRFALLAASVAVAAALGGLIGSVSTMSFAGPKAEAPANNTDKLQLALAQMSKEVGALKASIDASNRASATQVSKITERLDRSEKVQAEPAQKLAALAESVGKLEKRLASSTSADDHSATGSIPQRGGTSTAAKDESKPPIIQGWALREVYRGRALVESRNAIYEVGPGGLLPGIGRVESITQQNGRWVVVTPKGLIVSMR